MLLPGIYFTAACFDTHLHLKINFDLPYPFLIDKRLSCQVVRSQHISALDFRHSALKQIELRNLLPFWIRNCLLLDMK